MNIFQLICSFIWIVDVGSLVVVVCMFGISLVVVGQNIVWLEVYLGVCLFNCIICMLVLIECGVLYLVEVCYIECDLQWVQVVVIDLEVILQGCLCVVSIVVFGWYVLVLLLLVLQVCYLWLEIELLFIDCVVDYVCEDVDVSLWIEQ